MIITYFRSSSLNTWDSWCKQKYFLDYVLSLESLSGKKADIGTCVHKIMEILACCKKQIQEFPDEEHEMFDDCIGDIEFTKNDILLKDEHFMLDIVDRVYRYYTNKLNHHDWDQADKRDIDRLVKKALEFQNGNFDPRSQNIFEAEKRFDIEIQRDWAAYEYELSGEKIEGNIALKGTIDLIIKLDDNTLEVIDYKTGAHIKDWGTEKEKDLEYFQKKDKQLMTYYYALKMLYPNKDILMTIYYIRLGKAFTVHYDEKVLRDMEFYFKTRMKSIQATKVPKMVSPSQSSFKCTRLCHFYKNKWPGTNTNICRHIHNETRKHGIDYVTENYGTGKYNEYNSPG